MESVCVCVCVCQRYDMHSTLFLVGGGGGIFIKGVTYTILRQQVTCSTYMQSHDGNIHMLIPHTSHNYMCKHTVT